MPVSQKRTAKGPRPSNIVSNQRNATVHNYVQIGAAVAARVDPLPWDKVGRLKVGNDEANTLVGKATEDGEAYHCIAAEGGKHLPAERLAQPLENPFFIVEAWGGAVAGGEVAAYPPLDSGRKVTKLEVLVDGAEAVLEAGFDCGML